MTIYVQRFKEGNEDNQCCNRIMIIEMVQVCFSTPFQTKNGQICHDNPLTFKVDPHLYIGVVYCSQFCLQFFAAIQSNHIINLLLIQKFFKKATFSNIRNYMI